MRMGNPLTISPVQMRSGKRREKKLWEIGSNSSMNMDCGTNSVRTGSNREKPEGNRHSEEWRKEDNKRRKKPHSIQWEFIGVDGEGSTFEGDSIYQILAANVQGEVRSIESKEGLKTVDCLEFLLGLPFRKKKVAICGYGFVYDICNMLVDLPWRRLERLAKEDLCFYPKPGEVGKIIYKIRVIYKKSLEVWRLEKIERKWRSTGYVRVYDCIGFFQTSFLKAIERFGLPTKEEVEVIDRYKARRGENLEEDWEGWKKYNAIECRLLVRLMNEWNKTLISEGIY